MSELNGFPRGWFVIGWSHELAPDTVRPLRYLGRDLVLFRGADGKAAVLDAFCPHLGAHLGIGGTVVDGTVRCPFHAWRFGADGRCVDIPYAKKIPSRAQTRAWTTTEKFGVVFLWHDPADGPPEYDVPELEGIGGPEWTAWNTNVIEVKTHPREIVENVADKAHFPTVHRTDVEVFENEYDRHLAVQRTKGMARPPGGGIDHFDITATYHGPAFQLSDMRGVLHSRLLLAHTPIDEGRLDLRFAISLRRVGPRTEQFAEMYVENLRRGFHEDIAIWEHKVYRDRPVMCDGDGPLGRLRSWYRQFYGEARVG